MGHWENHRREMLHYKMVNARATWAGDYESKEDALAALQAQLEAKAFSKSGAPTDPRTE